MYPQKSYYSSRKDTKSFYQSSRSKKTKIASEKHRHKREYSRRMEAVSESEGSAGRHWKSKPKKQNSSVEDDLYQPWVCEETDPFTPWIRYFDFPKARIPSHIKTYDGSEDPEEHLKIFAAKTERWAMPTYYDDLRKAFLENYLQQKKCIKDPVEIHNIKQRDGECTEEFVRRNAKGRKTITFDQGIKAKPWKRPDKDSKKGETLWKDKPLAILMVQPWQRIVRQRITQTFSPESVISFLPLGEEDGTEGPMIIEAKMEGHCVHRIYVDGGSSSEILYEHYFSKFHPEIKNQLIPKNTPLFGVSGEIIWPIGSPSPYNEIIGRPGQIIPLECSMVSEPGVPRHVINQVMEEKIQVAIHPEYPEQTITIGSTLTEEGQKKLCGLLRRHLDVFAWKPVDMTGVPRHIAKHRLNVREGCLPVRQKKKGQAPERNKVIGEEVEKLVDADIMKEVYYHSWLSNPVMVKKHDDNWRMYVDFKDLNKSCPKDGYPLSEIDWNVESLYGYPYKCFMDAYKRYHQIKIAEKDEEKTAFITSQGIFCYSKVPFGLKNAGATYQRLVDKALKNILAETWREINMKLNPKKCAFKMREGTFLGYKVDADGLRVCPDKMKAVLNLPFQKMAFKGMKQLIAELSILTAPKKKEELIMYLAAAKEAIGAVLKTKRDEKQVPIYFVSRALQGPEINYTLMEKLILALVSASNRKAAQMEIQTRRARHSVPTKDVGKRTNSSGLHRGASRGRHTRYINGGQGRTPGPMDIIHGRIIMHRRFQSRLNNMIPKGMEFTYALRFRFNATNNEAEYEALIAGLRIAGKMGVQNLQANVDLKLVSNQVNRIYMAKESSMIKGENKKADALSKIESTSFAHLSKQVLVEELREKSVDEKEILAVVEEEGHTWMTPVYEYLTEGIIPEEKNKARVVYRKAGRYVVINKVSYKKSFLGPWLRCVGPLQANYVLREIHEGSCSMHAGSRSVVHHPVPWNPQEKLTTIISPWPFYKWGIDIAGPFLKGLGKVKLLIVAMDYFTKCIEAKTVATITGTQVKKFVWDNIVCRFGLPGEIVSDNGKQFRDNPFKDWCEKLRIKARLRDKNKNWVEEISHVLWAHRTMIKSSNRETPFSLIYGAEAVILAEIGMPTLRTAKVYMVKNNEALGISLDLLEEKREQAAIQEARSKAKMERYYNARVRSTSFHPRDFVYRNNEASHAEDGGKLEPKWEGPYEVTEGLGKGAYRLRDRNGHTLPRTWNICNIKKCYMHEM
nr:hypothetical protein [Tanacetum cinerariifolium]